jgi:hypothetical protein
MGTDQSLNAIARPGQDSTLTYLSRALNSQDLDEFITRVTDSAGNQIDPLASGDQPLDVSDARVGTDLEQIGGTAQTGVDIAARLRDLADALQTAFAADDQLRVDLQNNNAGALSTEQQTPVGVEDTGGTQIDPSVATDYLDTQITGHDLVGSGDLTIGPGAVKHGTAVIIAVTSTDNNAFSVSVTWEDGSGNVFQSQSAADIGLDTTTEDYSRLVRKGPQVEITVTDESGAGQNNINIHADTER